MKKTRAAVSVKYRDVIIFEKSRFQNGFHPHLNTKPASSNSSCLKSVFESLRFCDGVAWTVEVKPRFFTDISLT